MKENKFKKKGGDIFNTSLSKLSKKKPKRNDIKRNKILNFFQNFTLKNCCSSKLYSTFLHITQILKKEITILIQSFQKKRNILFVLLMKLLHWKS